MEDNESDVSILLSLSYACYKYLILIELKFLGLATFHKQHCFDI